MRILYVAMKYNYGIPPQGYSFEHENFYSTLSNMGHEILYFDFMSVYQEFGRERMNDRLWEVTITEKPDVLFCFLFGEEIDRQVMRRITEKTGTLTLNWFADDHWRFDNFSRFWAPCFHWVITTSARAMLKYQAAGIHNVIKSQWACNHHAYRNLDLPLQYDVTFVGMAHGVRRQVIYTLQNAGIQVHAWGAGWDNGRVEQTKMVRIFNQSRINLNFSSPSAHGQRLESVIRIVEKRWSKLGQLFRQALGLLYDPLRAVHPLAQIKGRNFEIPGCGGFLLTDLAENLADYYLIGKEIACFTSLKHLIQQVRYYLSHEQERQEIAHAGYLRTIREHTYQKRLLEIFRQAGLN